MYILYKEQIEFNMSRTRCSSMAMVVTNMGTLANHIAWKGVILTFGKRCTRSDLLGIHTKVNTCSFRNRFIKEANILKAILMLHFFRINVVYILIWIIVNTLLCAHFLLNRNGWL